MSGGTAAGVILALVYFMVPVVVALKPHEPAWRRRHRRDPAEGAR